MGEPTNTLAVLRRAIATELQMPFARRYSAGTSTVDASSTTSKIIDASLTQADGFWNGSWFYHPTTQGVSLMRAFIASEDSFQLEVPMSAMTTGDTYEIHSVFNAIDIRSAINRAIASAERVYNDTVTDVTHVLSENVLSYTISTLTKRPWIVNRVWIENKDAVRGTAVSATSTTLVVESSDILTPVTTAANWRVSIYDGTGKNQIRTVSSVASATITVTAWTTTPDSTSKYALWDATKEQADWILLESWRLDAKEYPDTLYLTREMPSLNGMRIRIEYIATPSALSAEADTTIVPSEYVIPKAISFLYGMRMKESKVDREVMALEAQRYNDMAEQFLVRNIPQKPDIMLKTPVSSDKWTESSNPLGW